MLVTVKDIQFNVGEGVYQSFWDSVNKAQWEPELFDLLDNLVDKETTVLDVGAWLGPVTLYVAQKVKHVYAFEPDPVAYNALLNNIKANTQINNVDILNACISTQEGAVRMGPRHEMGDSMSSLLFSGNDNNWSVQSITLDKFIMRKKIQGAIFLKMDIEGYEYLLMPALKNFFYKHDIILYLSTHPHIIGMGIKGQSFIDKLYRRFSIVKANFLLVQRLKDFRYAYDSQLNKINLFPRLLKSVFMKKLTEDGVIITSQQPLLRRS